MLYIIRFAKYDSNRWHDEFIGYVFDDEPKAQYAICIKDLYQESPFTGKILYKANTWYAWGDKERVI